MSPKQRAIFLTATWENLVMINYEIEPLLLQPYLPRFTEIDTFEGKTLVSLVGFMFTNTKVFGLHWPLHTTFEEVNLRFYVRHFDGNSWKRGVVFISEIVPSPIIAVMANKLYHEPYIARPMNHFANVEGSILKVGYGWKHKGKWNTLNVVAEASLNPIVSGSEEEFIFEHYWGYNRYNASTTIEYGVEHDVWQVHKVLDYGVGCDFAAVYGSSLASGINGSPSSVLLAKGSPVIIRKPIFMKE